MKSFKRIIAFILVLSLLVSMTSCASINGRPASFGAVMEFTVKALHYIMVVVTIGGFFTLLALVWQPDEDSVLVERMASWFTGVIDRMEEDLSNVNRGTDTAKPDKENSKPALPDTGNEPSRKNLFVRAWEGAKNVGATVVNGVKKATDAVVESFKCERLPAKYDKKDIKVYCRCGKETFEDLDFERFSYCLREPWWNPFWTETDQFLYTVKEFRRYYGVNHGLSPQLMEKMLELKKPELDAREWEKLEGIVGFLNDATDTISHGGAANETIAKALGTETEFFSAVNEYFGHANSILSAIQLGMHFADLDDAYRRGEAEDIVTASVDILSDAASLVKFAGLLYEAELNTVNKMLETVFDNLDRQQMALAMTAHPLFQNKAYWNKSLGDLANDTNWKNGPSLKELEQMHLTMDEIHLFSPYILFRIEYEVEDVFDVTLEELLESK